MSATRTCHSEVALHTVALRLGVGVDGMSDIAGRLDGRANLYNTIVSGIDHSLRTFPDNQYSSRSAIWNKIFDRRASPRQLESFDRMLDADNDVALGIANLSEPRFYAAYERLFETLFSPDEVERVIPGETGRPTLIRVHDIPAAIPVLQNETRVRQLLPYLQSGRPLRVLEIGAGYGGMANLLIKRGVVESYTIVDLPDNLAISAFFLTLENPEFTARVCPEQVTAAPGFLNFLLPNEIEKITDRSYDLVINCDSLGEMPSSVARAYVDFISRHLSDDGIFYSKNGVQRASGTCERLSDYGFENFDIVDVLPTPFSTGMLDDHSTVLILKKGRSDITVWRSLDIVAELFKFGLTAEIETLPQKLFRRESSALGRRFLYDMEQLFIPPYTTIGADSPNYGAADLEQARAYMTGVYEVAFGSIDIGHVLLEKYLERPLSALAESQAKLILSGGSGNIQLFGNKNQAVEFYLTTTKIPILDDQRALEKYFRASIHRAKSRFLRTAV